jgi:SAM-dependent methyltransferase
MLQSSLKHPLAKSAVNIDDPETTRLRYKILRSKSFLCKIYKEWYRKLAAEVPSGEGMVVELGSGAGFIKEEIPEALTTDVLEGLEGIDMLLPKDGTLPFPDKSLKALLMTDVLHHINTPRSFFLEAARVIRPGGVLLMIEPWATPWSSFIYRNLHSEPFEPDAKDWEFPSSGPLSGANGALPWMLFKRDRERFEKEFPQWAIHKIQPMMPFAYLLSGGLSYRSFAPGCLYEVCRRIERSFAFLETNNAMFAFIHLTYTL